MCRVSSQRTTSASASSLSTRSVTSSRLPIGVAQTASGTATAARRAPRSRRGPPRRARHPPPSSASTIRSPSRPGASASARADSSAAREEERRRGRTEAAADDDELRPEHVHERPDRDAEERGRSRRAPPQRPRRPPRPVRRAARRVEPRTPERLGGAVGRVPGRERLEVTAPRAVALARRPVGDDDHVPELGPAAVEGPAEHEAAADARAEREHDEVVRPAARAQAPFGERGRVRVVLDRGRDAEALAQHPRERDPGERDVRRVERAPRRGGRARTGRRGRVPRSRRRRDRRRPGRSPRRAPPASRSGSGSSEVWRTVPSRSSTPARIFVPPRSTPMTRWALTGRGYHNRPDGRGREAVQALQGRAHEGEGARRRPASARTRARRRPQSRRSGPAQGPRPAALGKAHRARARAPRRPARRLDGRELPLLPGRGDRRERPPAEGRERRARAAGGSGDLEPDPDHAARHRRGQERRALRLEPLRLDPDRPHRSEAAPDLVPLDPPRPPRRDPGLRREQDQRGLPARRTGADDARR